MGKTALVFYDLALVTAARMHGMHAIDLLEFQNVLVLLSRSTCAALCYVVRSEFLLLISMP